MTEPTESALRAAMAGGGTVTFACDGTITLATTITNTLHTSLDAAGRQVTISGGGNAQVFRVEPGVRLTLLNLGIANGRSDAAGGVHNAGGTVNATNCVFSGNTAQGMTDGDGLAAWGGAVWNGGWFNASRCAFRGNRALGGTGADGRDGSNLVAPGGGRMGGPGYGGAIYNWGTMVVERSLFASNNAAGGAGGRGGDGSWFTYYPCPDQSGGNGGPGGDGLGGDLFNAAGTASVVNCTFAANGGSGGAGGRGGNGGLINWNPHSASGCPGGNGGNGAGAGGTICQSLGQCLLTNCTIAANSATGGVGGIRGYGSLGLPGGSPGGDGTGWGGVTSYNSTLVNVLLSTNLPGGNASGLIVDGGGNLSSDDSCHFTAPGSLNNTDPRLGPLGDNGGSTLTMPLLPGSRAIDGGDTAAAPATDQRGFPRPFGLAADIGALEVMPWLSIQRVPGVGLDILASGLLDKSCRLLASSNLATWQPVATSDVGADGTAVFHATLDPGILSQFYRVIVP